jgi:hypothetical protein
MKHRFRGLFDGDKAPVAPVNRDSMVDVLTWQFSALKQVKCAHTLMAETPDDELDMTLMKDTLQTVLQSQAALMTSISILLQSKINERDRFGD